MEAVSSVKTLSEPSQTALGQLRQIDFSRYVFRQNTQITSQMQALSPPDLKTVLESFF